MSTTDIDYKSLRERVSLHQGIQYLGLKAIEKNGTFRTACPACRRGGDRALAITPMKGWSCWANGGNRPGASGLDATSLVAHVKGVTNHNAAIELIRHYAVEKEPRAPSPAPKQVREARPLDYLTYTEAVEGLGISEETCREWGAGFAPRGTMIGRFLVPIRRKDGSYYVVDDRVQYVGIAMSPEQSPRYQFADRFKPQDVIFGADRITSDEVRLVQDVISVLIASQTGEQAICFMTELVDPLQHQMLAALQDEKQFSVFY
jgi:hypothetical protein